MRSEELFDKVTADILSRGPKPRKAKHPITPELVSLLTDLTGDTNPSYTDEKWAKTSRWHGLIVPQLSMNMWTLPGFNRAHEYGEPLDIIRDQLNDMGCTSVAAVGNNHTYLRPLRFGEKLNQHQELTSVVGPKSTRLGTGYFFDITSKFINDEGELVGTAVMTIFKWRPKGDLPSITTNSENQNKEQDLIASNAGGNNIVNKQLKSWDVPISATLIAGLAAATFDFNDVHMDKEAAKAAGADDIYLNILGSSALLNRYLTDNLGPEVWIDNAQISLHSQTYPGDILTFAGDFSAPPESGDSPTTLDVTVSNVRGVFMRAKLSLSIQ